LYLSLKACGVTAGSKVAVNAMCCNSVTLAIEALNARPVYIDTEPGNFCLSTDATARLLSRGDIQAVIAAHFVGQRSDMSRIVALCGQNGVPLIDDAAYQAGLRIGRSWAGTSGQLGIWSFNHKLLSGPEGAIVIASGEHLERLRRQVADLPLSHMSLREGVRFCGQALLRRLLGSHIPRGMSGQVAPTDWRTPAPVSLTSPCDWRASERQCGIMFAQLHRVDTVVNRVTASAAMYRQLLRGTIYAVGDLPYGGVFGRTVPVHWQVGADTNRRPCEQADRTLRIRRYLFAKGVQTLFYVPPWWWEGAEQAATLSNCGDLWSRTLFVPNHPLLRPADIAHVCRCLVGAWGVSLPPSPCKDRAAISVPTYFGAVS
jgi:dTDP-4-amino-4,6-dideoxygalactose transaminase